MGATFGPEQIEPLIEGALGLRRSPGAVQPIRLPVEDLELHHPALRRAFTAEAAAGIRLRFRTSSRRIVLETDHDTPEYPAAPTYDLVLEDGAVRSVVAARDAPVAFDELPDDDKVVEIWLPPGLGVLLRGLTVDPGCTVEPAPQPGPRWVTYGSSVTQCGWVRPTETWPAIVARSLGWHLTCLGFNGSCHLDPLVARAMAALPADRFTLELGINVHNLQTMRERTFGPFVHGFLASLRDAHADTRITVVSPIASPEREYSPVSDILTRHSGGEALVGDLTLNQMRSILHEVVETRRKRGDGAIDYLDGRVLLGDADIAHLPDGLHPDAGGYALMAARFIERVQSSPPAEVGQYA